MGFHSFLQGQNVPFESALAKSWNMRIFKHLRREADKASKAAALASLMAFLSLAIGAIAAVVGALSWRARGTTVVYR